MPELTSTRSSTLRAPAVGRGRHQRPVPRWLVGGIGTVAGLLTVASVALLWADTWPAPVTATAAPIVAERADDPGARGSRPFPRLVRPTIVPADATPWSPEMGPVIVDGKPLEQVRPTPPAVVAAAAPRPVGLPSVTPPATAPAPTAAGEPAPVGCTVPAVAGCPVSTPPADQSTPPPSCTAPQVLDPATNQCVSPEPEPPADPPAAVEVAVGDAPAPEPTP